MAPRRSRRRPRRVRIRRPPQLTDVISATLGNGTTLPLDTNGLSVGTTRGIRPIHMRLQFAFFDNDSGGKSVESNPVMIQVRCYNNLGHQITMHGPYLCGSTTNKTFNVRFTNTGWFSPGTVTTFAAIDNICYAKQEHVLAAVVIHIRYICSQNYLSDDCPKTIRAIPTSEFHVQNSLPCRLAPPPVLTSTHVTDDFDLLSIHSGDVATQTFDENTDRIFRQAFNFRGYRPSCSDQVDNQQ